MHDSAWHSFKVANITECVALHYTHRLLGETVQINNDTFCVYVTENGYKNVTPLYRLLDKLVVFWS